MAKEYEKRRKAEMERAAAGLPTEQKATRIRTVADVVKPYLDGYKLNHRPKSVLFAKGRLAHVKKALGNVVLSDLTDDRIRDYIRQRQARRSSGRTINMEVGRTEPGHRPAVVVCCGRRCGRLEERKDVGRALSPNEQKALLDGLKDRRTPHLPTLIPLSAADRHESGRGAIAHVGPGRSDGQDTHRRPGEDLERHGPH